MPLAQRHKFVAVCALTSMLAAPAFGQDQAAAGKTAVTAVTLEERNVTPSSTFTGRVEAIESVDLRARVEGFLEKRLFEEGSLVKKGDLLFQIEKAPYQTTIDATEADIIAAKGELALADIEVQRQTELVEKKAVAQSKLDEANAQQAKAKGALLHDQASLERAKLDLSYTDIYSPIDGRISRTPFSEGDLVNPNSGILATIVSQDPIYVTFPISVSQLVTLREQAAESGMTRDDVRFHVELANGTPYDQEGKIAFVGVQAQQGTDTVAVRGTIANPDQALIDEAVVTVVVDIGKPTPRIVVPQAAVQFDQQGRYVLTVGDGNKVAVARITVESTIGAFYVVSDGLAAGDRVITEGLQKVRAGQEVDVTAQDLPPLQPQGI